VALQGRQTTFAQSRDVQLILAPAGCRDAKESARKAAKRSRETSKLVGSTAAKFVGAGTQELQNLRRNLDTLRMAIVVRHFSRIFRVPFSGSGARPSWCEKGVEYRRMMMLMTVVVLVARRGSKSGRGSGRSTWRPWMRRRRPSRRWTPSQGAKRAVRSRRPCLSACHCTAYVCGTKSLVVHNQRL
jgi:hypothetical protein